MLVVSHKASAGASPAVGGLEQRPVMLQELGASCSWPGGEDRHPQRVIQPLAGGVLRIEQKHPLEVPVTFH